MSDRCAGAALHWGPCRRWRGPQRCPGGRVRPPIPGLVHLPLSEGSSLKRLKLRLRARTMGIGHARRRPPPAPGPAPGLSGLEHARPVTMGRGPGRLRVRPGPPGASAPPAIPPTQAATPMGLSTGRQSRGRGGGGGVGRRARARVHQRNRIPGIWRHSPAGVCIWLHISRARTRTASSVPLATGE